MVNLLGSKENEATLTATYANHLNRARNIWGDQLSITHYDFHYAVKMAGHDSILGDIEYVSGRFLFLSSDIVIRRLKSISGCMEQFGYTLSDASTGEPITLQGGVFRTNCLDW